MPLVCFGSRRGMSRLQIAPVARILPNLGDMRGVPAGRLDGRDLAKDDFAEEIRIVAAAQMNHVLDSALALDGCADLHFGCEHHVGLTKIFRDDAGVLMALLSGMRLP